MPEWLFNPDSGAAALPASLQDQNSVGQQARVIGEHPAFRRSRHSPNDFSASYFVLDTAVTLNLFASKDVLIELEEPFSVEEFPSDRIPELAFFKRSTYRFIHNASSNDYKYASFAARESYFVSNKGKVEAALPSTALYARRFGLYIKDKAAVQKEVQDLEALWGVGTLTTARCAQLIHLAEAFNPQDAKTQKR